MPRNRRPKTRLMGGMSDDQRVSLRQKALDMASKGLANQTAAHQRMAASRGPVHEGSPAAQEQSAARLGGEKRVARDNRTRFSAFTLHQNQTGNARAGRTFRSYARPGGTVHDYGDRKVFVKDTGGTGNRHAPRSAGDSELQSLAAVRAKRGGRKSRRRYFGVGSG